MKNRLGLFNYNKEIIICFVLVIVLVGFGCLMVFSASSYLAQYRYSNPYHFLTKQIIGASIGLVLMVICSFIDYRKYIKLRWIAVFVSIILLLLVFMPVIGVENYGAHRWIQLPGFTFQPSELAKFTFVLFSAYYLSKNYDKIKTFKGILPVVLLGGIYCILIILEPNMSITMCMGIVMLIMLFVGGAGLKQFLIIALPTLAMVPVLIIAEPYRIKRLIAFLDPWATPQAEGFQLIQSLYSIGSGGWFGVGLFQSRQKYLFLPFSESDFIFSIIAEEFGFLGSVFLIGVFITLIVYLVKIGLNAKDRFGCLFSIGVASVIAVQVLINIAVVTGSIPPTGLPLPFISAGSTSLIVFMAAVGICLNISKTSKKV